MKWGREILRGSHCIVYGRGDVNRTGHVSTLPYYGIGEPKLREYPYALAARGDCAQEAVGVVQELSRMDRIAVEMAVTASDERTGS